MSAQKLALAQGVRGVTLTDIAADIGMHKSALLRYFETREAIFLHLAKDAWSEWSHAAKAQLDALSAQGVRNPSGAAAHVLSATLAQRPLFCDLLAHVPLNLERGVSIPAVKDFKVTAIAAAGQVATALEKTLDLPSPATWNVVSTATAMAGALWQMAAPGTELRALYESDPELAHAIVDVEPRLNDIITALINGYTSDGNI